jgi:hypothetical protein
MLVALRGESSLEGHDLGSPMLFYPSRLEGRPNDVIVKGVQVVLLMIHNYTARCIVVNALSAL